MNEYLRRGLLILGIGAAAFYSDGCTCYRSNERPIIVIRAAERCESDMVYSAPELSKQNPFNGPDARQRAERLMREQQPFQRDRGLEHRLRAQTKPRLW